jgi:hypothetical protein
VFNAQGGASGPDLELPELASSVRNYAVTGLTNGDWVLVWVDTTIAGSGREPTQTLQFRRYTSSAQLVQDTTAEHTGAFLTVAPEIQVEATSDGGFAVAWSANLSLVPPNAMFQRFTPAGIATGPLAFADGGTARGAMTLPRLAALADGSLIVLWLQAEEGNIARTVTMQHFDANSASLGGPSPLTASTAAGEYQFSATTLVDGSIGIGWTEPLGAQRTPRRASWLITDAAGAAKSSVGSTPIGIFIEGIQLAPATDGFFLFTQLSSNTGPGGTTTSTVGVLPVNSQGQAQGAPAAVVSRSTLNQNSTGALEAGPADTGFAVDGGSDGHYVLVYEGAVAQGASVFVLGQ